MKRITLFLTTCLGLSVFQTALCADTDSVRAATKRGATNTVQTKSVSTRSTNTSSKNNLEHSENTRTSTQSARTATNVQSRTPTTQKQTVKQRVSVPSRQAKTVTTRTQSVKPTNSVVSRTASTKKSDTKQKSTATRKAVNKQPKHVGRATTLNEEKIQEIKSKDYSKCRTVYWECMDEFCANKDTNLRRCACSNRIHEFDGVKENLSNAEEKMFEFNQRLLMVNMDKEDVTAISTATEGEDASTSTEDKSDSELLLQKITSALNNSDDSKIKNNLSSISLDLDIENAWDTVDSIGGIATSAKTGLALYDAAQPVCLEMAKEVCSEEEMVITRKSYELAIQQDCNTVKSAYNSKYNETIGKVRESSALLDMARLNAYQQRNSDDLLTCKRKILDKLSDSSICGEKLYKCLDVTGQYINPADGSVFLSENLSNLTTLITKPTDANAKWSTVTSNAPFVSFLNSKRDALEIATEKCQDMADTIWKEFLDDALAQIKLAQNNKLEEIRRNCTKLVTDCKKEQSQNIKEFDQDALLTFNVLADATVNEMCRDITNACTALMNTTFEDDTWASGITGVEADISYETILETCMDVGRVCLTQKCAGTSDNFALCKETLAPTRQAILKREYCWTEVENCVKQATNLNAIYDYYTWMQSATFGDTPNWAIPTFDKQYKKTCDTETEPEGSASPDKIACLITHKIWGDCKLNDITNTETGIFTQSGCILPKTAYKTTGDCNNTIPITNNEDTLLGILADGTSNPDCDLNRCDIGYEYYPNYADHDKYPQCLICAQKIQTTDGTPTDRNNIIEVTENITNYCKNGCERKDHYRNCCAYTNTLFEGSKVDNEVCVPDLEESPEYNAHHIQTVTCNGEDKYYCPNHDSTNPKNIKLYCILPTDKEPTYDTETDSITCPDGYWVLVDDHGNYFNPATKDLDDKWQPISEKGMIMSYQPSKTDQPCIIMFIPDQQEWNAVDQQAYPLTECTVNINPKNRTENNHFKIRFYK